MALFTAALQAFKSPRFSACLTTDVEEKRIHDGGICVIQYCRLVSQGARKVQQKVHVVRIDLHVSRLQLSKSGCWGPQQLWVLWLVHCHWLEEFSLVSDGPRVDMSSASSVPLGGWEAYPVSSMLELWSGGLILMLVMVRARLLAE